MADSASSIAPELREPLKKFLYRLADDLLIVAHRESEWTGLGPTLEEDIAFSSIAQDKLGHSLLFYQILHTEFGEDDPDTIAFTRDEKEYTCCHLTELPIGDYAFSLTRHLLFDLAEQLRFEMFEGSSYEPLAKIARKMHGEIKYHLFHAVTWFTQLAGKGNEESKARMQTALNETFPLALGIFEPSDGEEILIEHSVYAGEEALKEKWIEAVKNIVDDAGLDMPDMSKVEPALGGRKGYHTEHLQPLLDEMTEVFRIDPEATW